MVCFGLICSDILWFGLVRPQKTTHNLVWFDFSLIRAKKTTWTDKLTTAVLLRVNGPTGWLKTLVLFALVWNDMICLGLVGFIWVLFGLVQPQKYKTSDR